MPTSTALVAQLHSIAHDMIGLAILWHVALAIALVTFLAGWRPTRRGAAALLALPIASTGLVAFGHGNAFNGMVFSGLAIALLGIAGRMPTDRISYHSRRELVVGQVFVVFGAIYPHFLDELALSAYLVASPFGVLPSPTLVVLAGFTLMVGGFSRAWASLRERMSRSMRRMRSWLIPGT